MVIPDKWNSRYQSHGKWFLGTVVTGSADTIKLKHTSVCELIWLVVVLQNLWSELWPQQWSDIHSYSEITDRRILSLTNFDQSNNKLFPYTRMVFWAFKIGLSGYQIFLWLSDIRSSNWLFLNPLKPDYSFITIFQICTVNSLGICIRPHSISLLLLPKHVFVFNSWYFAVKQWEGSIGLILFHSKMQFENF